MRGYHEDLRRQRGVISSRRSNLTNWLFSEPSSYIGVARILSGVHYFLPKMLTTFFSHRPQRTSKHTSKSNPPSKNCPKNWLLLWLGSALRVLWGALTHFPCKLRLNKNFFTALGVQVHPLHPLSTPMSSCQLFSEPHTISRRKRVRCRRVPNDDRIIVGVLQQLGPAQQAAVAILSSVRVPRVIAGNRSLPATHFVSYQRQLHHVALTNAGTCGNVLRFQA